MELECEMLADSGILVAKLSHHECPVEAFRWFDPINLIFFVHIRF